MTHFKIIELLRCAVVEEPKFTFAAKVIVNNNNNNNICLMDYPVNWYQKGKTNLALLMQETVSDSGISRAICKSEPCRRQIILPAPHHPVFTGRMPFLLPNQQHKFNEGSGTEVLEKWL